MSAPKVYYRVLPTDGRVLKEMKDYYDGIVIEANILEQYSNYVTSLLSVLRKPFFIDPTHKFVHFSLNHIAEKEWFVKILEAYRISECLQEEVINLELLRENLELFVKAVIDYQRSRVVIPQGLEIFITHSEELPIKPEIVLTPYFLIDDVDNEAYNINLEILEKSVEIKGEEKLYAVLALEKHLLYHDNLVSKIKEDYVRDGVDGLCVWVIDFNECEEDEKTLEKYITFFKEISEVKKPVINLYGGTLSVFIGKLGFISSIVQGINYGEYRNPFLQPTGAYPRRYYIPRIHRFAPIHIAQELIALIPELECECDFCRREDITGKSEKEVSIDFLKKHYLANRWNEAQEDFQKLYEELTDIREELQKKQNIIEKYWPYLRHIEKWCTVLEKFKT